VEALKSVRFVFKEIDGNEMGVVVNEGDEVAE
jgi:hypothetical protein